MSQNFWNNYACVFFSSVLLELEEGLESIEGNLSRDLWKITCWEMAKDVRM